MRKNELGHNPFVNQVCCNALQKNSKKKRFFPMS